MIYNDKNNVFGGYTSKSWTKSGSYCKDKNAFLFLLRSSKNYKPQIFNLLTDKQNNHLPIENDKSLTSLFNFFLKSSSSQPIKIPSSNAL